jgi:hypothetical protein
VACALGREDPAVVALKLRASIEAQSNQQPAHVRSIVASEQADRMMAIHSTPMSVVVDGSAPVISRPLVTSRVRCIGKR